MKVELACYGTGNFNNEFAINQYNDLLFKYRTKYANGRINDEQMQYIENLMSEKMIVTVEGFLTQLDGSPRLLYLLNLYKALIEDNTTEGLDKTKINELYSDFLISAYNSISGIESLTKIAFDDIDEHIIQLEEVVQQRHYDFAKKYDVQLTDFAGVTITLEEARTYQNVFMDLETNYNLHAEFILYIYKEMQRLNNLYSIQAFSA
jgi:hypothetical protein